MSEKAKIQIQPRPNFQRSTPADASRVEAFVATRGNLRALRVAVSTATQNPQENSPSGVCTTYTRLRASQPLRRHHVPHATISATPSASSPAPASPPSLAILSLALGIGATTAIFSVVYAVLIDPYPYTAADRIGGFHLLNAKNDDAVTSATPSPSTSR